jgi:hypothetical protein
MSTKCTCCQAYLEDTIESAAVVEFGGRRAGRIRPYLQRLAYELGWCIRPIFGQIEAYRNYRNQLEMMMKFAGAEKMLEAFYAGQPAAKKNLELWSYVLVDAGLGRPEHILDWLQMTFFTLFANLIDIHKEHSREQPVSGAEVPATQIYGCKLTQAAKAAAEARAAPFQEELQFDDLYA